MTLKIAIAALLIAGLSSPSLAKDAEPAPPAGFDEAAWQAEWDANNPDGGPISRERAIAANPRIAAIFDQIDTDGDGHLSAEEDKAAVIRWHRDREGAAAEQ